MNGSLVTLTENSITMHDPDEPLATAGGKGSSSPAQAYSDKKAKKPDSLDMRGPMTGTTLGRTNTGFSVSSNYSNSRYSAATVKQGSSNNMSTGSGVVLLHDMADRSRV